jgi:hypothetical protein
MELLKAQALVTINAGKNEKKFTGRGTKPHTVDFISSVVLGVLGLLLFQPSPSQSLCNKEESFSIE